jgi:GWxTD domain-containing protein
MKINYFLNGILLVLVIFSCNSPLIVNQNMSFLYEPEDQLIKPEFSLSNLNDSISSIRIGLNPNHLLFTKDFNVSKYFSRFQIAYAVYPSLNESVISDSDTIEFREEGYPGGNQKIIKEVSIKAAINHNYFIKVKISDLNRNYSEEYLLHLEKLNSSSKENFAIYSTNKGSSRFHVQLNDSIQLNVLSSSTDKLFISEYSRILPISPPPFSMFMDVPFNHTPDEEYTIEKVDGNWDFIPKNQGFYLIKTDSLHENGLLLRNFNEHFPKVQTPEELLQPLRLLCSKQEFANLQNEGNIKLAIDNFWISNCGSRERAKHVIKKFYGRVELANEYFSDFKEGWKTDRGIIFVIFGPPNKVYKSDGGENWLYGEDNNLMSLNFIFRNQINPYSKNIFRLDRISVYKNSWYRMIDAWRNGRIFTEDDEEN